MFYMRHGESTFNAGVERLGRDPQIPDPILSPLGERQARASAERLAQGGVAISKIVSSPFTRAIQTARIVASVLEKPIIRPPLEQFNEGLTWA